MRAKTITTLLFLLSARWALAIPTLQLDIVSGTYDEVTETIVSSESTFTLVAVLTPKENATAEDIEALLATSHFISAAVSPMVGSPSILGSFDFDEATIHVTSDMEFGTPPLESALLAEFDPGDLSKHSIFETFFSEVAFQFESSGTTARYNTADDPGGLDPSGTGAFYATFDVDITNLAPGYALHFDLYNTEVAELRGRDRGLDVEDIDVDDFAPFSHDAEGRQRLPAPGTLVLLGAGLALVALSRRRRA